MKFYKNKFTIIAGTLLFILALTACGSDDSTDDPTSEINVQEGGVQRQTTTGGSQHIIEVTDGEDEGVQIIEIIEDEESETD